MADIKKTGRVTIPTDLDVVPQTLDILQQWAQMPSVTATERIFPSSCGMQMQRSTLPTTPPARTTPGPKPNRRGAAVLYHDRLLHG